MKDERMNNQKMFLIVYPSSRWVTKEAILTAHSIAISRGECSIESRTEDVNEAMAALDDAGLYAFEKD